MKAEKRQMKFRVTEKEYKAIKNNIKKSEMSQQDYLLKSALKKKITVNRGLEEIYKELLAEGNNLNQLARAANRGQLPEIEEQIHKQLGELKEVWLLLRRYLQNQG